MPFFIEAGKAARIIRKGLLQNQARIAFPWPMNLIMWLIGALPVTWSDTILSRTPQKE